MNSKGNNVNGSVMDFDISSFTNPNTVEDPKPVNNEPTIVNTDDVFGSSVIDDTQVPPTKESSTASEPVSQAVIQENVLPPDNGTVSSHNQQQVVAPTVDEKSQEITIEPTESTNVIDGNPVTLENTTSTSPVDINQVSQMDGNALTFDGGVSTSNPTLAENTPVAENNGGISLQDALNTPVEVAPVESSIQTPVEVVPTVENVQTENPVPPTPIEVAPTIEPVQPEVTLASSSTEETITTAPQSTTPAQPEVSQVAPVSQEVAATTQPVASAPVEQASIQEAVDPNKIVTGIADGVEVNASNAMPEGTQATVEVNPTPVPAPATPIEQQTILGPDGKPINMDSTTTIGTVNNASAPDTPTVVESNKKKKKMTLPIIMLVIIIVVSIAIIILRRFDIINFFKQIIILMK